MTTGVRSIIAAPTVPPTRSGLFARTFATWSIATERTVVCSSITRNTPGSASAITYGSRPLTTSPVVSSLSTPAGAWCALGSGSVGPVCFRDQAIATFNPCSTARLRLRSRAW